MAEEKQTPLKWKFKTEDGVSSPPTVAEGVVYFGGSKKNLYAVYIYTGGFTANIWEMAFTKSFSKSSNSADVKVSFNLLNIPIYMCLLK